MKKGGKGEKRIGTVTHWYDKIGVAVVKLSGTLAAGDTIRVRKGEDEFEETVSSMQLDHASIASAKKGQDVAIRLTRRAKEGAGVFLAR